ncbi:MAG: hypothetical protein AAFZ15_34225 [Bacteroidota bacterium]
MQIGLRTLLLNAYMNDENTSRTDPVEPEKKSKKKLWWYFYLLEKLLKR